jgi:hypothetical protein
MADSSRARRCSELGVCAAPLFLPFEGVVLSEFGL